MRELGFWHSTEHNFPTALVSQLRCVWTGRNGCRILFCLQRLFGRTAVVHDTASSQRWLARQRSDPYVRRARLESFRCRSAFKLIQLDERVPGGLIHPQDVVVDCGAAPGSWTQVAASICAKSGLVISFDLLDFPHVPGARCYPHTDVQDWELCAGLVDRAIAEHYANSKVGDRPFGVSLVLSDMAPNASGIRDIDIPAMMNLASAVLQLAIRVSTPGASLVIKLWQCPEAEPFRKMVSQFYHGPWDSISATVPKKNQKISTSATQSWTMGSVSPVRFLKPAASRSDSAEIYLVAKGFVPDCVIQTL